MPNFEDDLLPLPDLHAHDTNSHNYHLDDDDVEGSLFKDKLVDATAKLVDDDDHVSSEHHMTDQEEEKYRSVQCLMVASRVAEHAGIENVSILNDKNVSNSLSPGFSASSEFVAPTVYTEVGMGPLPDLNLTADQVADTNIEYKELDDLFSSFQRIARTSNMSQPKKNIKIKSKINKKKLTVDNFNVSPCLDMDEDNTKVMDDPNGDIDFAFVGSDGASGGIVTMWGNRSFCKEQLTEDPNFLCVLESWVSIPSKVGLLNVYGPQSSSQKDGLWLKIEYLIRSTKAVWILFEDFNVVRNIDERAGSIFDHREANIINDFIARNGLFDFPLGGRKFTRIDKAGLKLCKLDRFLVGLPNFGPNPFKVFDKWIGDVEMLDVVKCSWAFSPFRGRLTPDLILKDKLKKLRLDIKNWTLKMVAAQRIE
ncbi:RNA-directed DNA polymerase, eukaryota [Tanacetum coccineum]